MPTLSTLQGIIPSPAWRLATTPTEKKKRPVNREGILTRKATQFLVIPLFTVMLPNEFQ